MPLNVELLQRAKAQILAEPERVNQAHWVREGGDPCGTIGCLAGHVVHLTYPGATPCSLNSVRLPDGTEYHVAREAERLLGLLPADRNRLFSASGQSSVTAEPHTRAHAEQVAAHIDRFIADYTANGAAD
jgi:hypothetical protein